MAKFTLHELVVLGVRWRHGSTRETEIVAWADRRLICQTLNWAPEQLALPGAAIQVGVEGMWVRGNLTGDFDKEHAACLDVVFQVAIRHFQLRPPTDVEWWCDISDDTTRAEQLIHLAKPEEQRYVAEQCSSAIADRMRATVRP